jgi:CheY-like chemotaxis protein
MRRRIGRVLVVDHEPLSGAGLARALSGHCEVVVETEAAAGLARLFAGERFDVVLCDLMMPSMDGLSFYEALAASMPEAAQRVVFMTSGILSADAEAFFARISNVVLEKPIDAEGLQALVARRIDGTLVDCARTA